MPSPSGIDWVGGALSRDLDTEMQAHQDNEDVLRQIPGGASVEDHTISGGAIAPTKGVARVDTEGGASSDDLDSIGTSSLPDGSRLWVLPNNDSRTVVLKHGSGALGDLDLTNANSVDLELNNTTMYAVLQRRGNVWLLLQVMGREDFHPVASSFSGYSGTWQDGASLDPKLRYYKDAAGEVTIEGWVENTATLQAADSGSTIFPLPFGYRSLASPGQRQYIVVDEDYNLHGIQINVANVRWTHMGNDLAAGKRLAIFGIRFRAEQ